jgi:hypothetical protein
MSCNCPNECKFGDFAACNNATRAALEQRIPWGDANKNSSVASLSPDLCESPMPIELCEYVDANALGEKQAVLMVKKQAVLMVKKQKLAINIQNSLGVLNDPLLADDIEFLDAVRESIGVLQSSLEATQGRIDANTEAINANKNAIAQNTSGVAALSAKIDKQAEKHATDLAEQKAEHTEEIRRLKQSNNARRKNAPTNNARKPASYPARQKFNPSKQFKQKNAQGVKKVFRIQGKIPVYCSQWNSNSNGFADKCNYEDKCMFHHASKNEGGCRRGSRD